MVISSGGTETVYYTVTDTQGTVYKLLNSAGTVVASYNYDPFGYRIENTNPTIYMPLGFAATYYDSETGLNFAQQRYYDSVTGRFTTKDSYRGDAGSPISQNRYIYCHQNPISFADPSGFKPMEGEHASDSTPTEHKTEHKTDVKPPESKPNMMVDNTKEDNSWKNLKPGQGKKIGDKSYVNVGGFIVEITKDEKGVHAKTVGFNNGNGFMKVLSGGDSIAKGIEDGLNALPSNIVDDLLKDDSSVGLMAFKLNDFFNKYFKKNVSQSMFRSMSLSDFMFSAVIGYATAMYITTNNPSKNPVENAGDQLLINLMQTLLNAQGKGELSFDAIMDIGFWTAYNNSKIDGKTGHRKLNLDFSLSQSSLSDKVSFLDLVRIQTALYINTLSQTLIKNGKLTEANWEDIIYNSTSLILGVVSTILGAVEAGTAISAALFAPVAIVTLIVGLLVIGANFTNINPNAWITDSGITNDMLPALWNLGLSRNSYFNKNDMFVSIGLMCTYYKACLDQTIDYSTEYHDNYLLGDMFVAYDLYGSRWFPPGGSLSRAFSLINKVDEFLKTYKNITNPNFKDFYDNYYGQKGKCGTSYVYIPSP